MGRPGLFLFIFVFSIQLTFYVQYKFCQPWDWNRGLLASEATTLPTELQPLPNISMMLLYVFRVEGGRSVDGRRDRLEAVC